MQSIASVSRTVVRPRPARSRAPDRGARRVAVTAARLTSSDTEPRGHVVGIAKKVAGFAAGAALGLMTATAPPPAAARLEGVNNPQMLPAGPPQEVLDVAGESTHARARTRPRAKRQPNECPPNQK